MNSKHLEVLKKYWGYDAFRPLQDEIIQSVASGRDTLGLMPTGGGKSLTFQVPTMCMQGVCIVVTPLIALMKDQVENLKQKQIQAAAIYSGLSQNEILVLLDNCVHGAYKFLYVSPERLATPLFLEKLKQMTVCLIAVDESHCISQWGYDFRPSYLRIADIRLLLPGVPLLALTATATPEVVKDIQEKLLFKESNVFQKSFYRSNLVYVVRKTADKNEQLLKILSKVDGTSIVYVRNRKKTKEIAEFLSSEGIGAEHFHAGLSNETKDSRQKRWKSGKTRVIVSTNAFGMGIDKPDVRTVVHLDLPDSLEAYFQEAGRAGRDEKRAYAVLLFNETDNAKVKKRIADNFPEKDFILKVYEALGNYYQVAAGSGLNRSFPFEIADFCARFHLPILTTYSALKILQQAGYVELTDVQDNSSRVLFTVKKDELYAYKHTDEQERLIHVLLRSYTGLFTEPAYMSEETLAKRLQWGKDKVYQQLVGLAKEQIIQYIPRKNTAFITFTSEREEIKRVALTKEAYENKKERFVKRVKSVLEYAKEENVCRSRVLLAYFGEKNTADCGLCDVCRKKKEKDISEDDFQQISEAIQRLLKEQKRTSKQLIQALNVKEEKALTIIRFLLDNGQIRQNEDMRIELVN